jgi:single-stranded-DNA-specific exonuclease
LGSADVALELLLSRNAKDAERLAQEIERRNVERQQMERRITAEAIAAVEAMASLPPILMLWGEGWHRGVMGISAGRLARKYERPALLMAIDG